jgi:uncharacterized protein YjdB
MRISSRNLIYYSLVLVMISSIVLAGCSAKSTSSTGTVSPTKSATARALSLIEVYPGTPPNQWAGYPKPFVAWATYSDGTNEEITSKVTWMSENTDVATVDSEGIVTGITSGTTNITASLSGITSPVVTVTIIPGPSSLEVTPGPVTDLLVGNIEQYTAMGTFPDGTTEDITSQVNWSSDKTDIATIDADGLVTGVTPGTTHIKASVCGITSPPVTLTVIFPKLSSIAVTPIPSNLWVNFTMQFKAIGTYSNGYTKDISTEVTWNSTDISVATVSADGLATAVSPGTTYISATLSGVKSGDISLRVITPPQ